MTHSLAPKLGLAEAELTNAVPNAAARASATAKVPIMRAIFISIWFGLSRRRTAIDTRTMRPPKKFACDAAHIVGKFLRRPIIVGGRPEGMLCPARLGAKL